MNLTGQLIKDVKSNLSFPVCNSFKSTTFDGQLCYSIEVENNIHNEKKLLLAIDPESSLVEDKTPKLGKTEKKPVGMIMEREKIPSNSISIHLNNLVRYTDARPGIYKLSQLKKMSGSDGFLGLPNEMKQCQIEAEEECRTRSFFEALQDRCSCVPWSLRPMIETQVRKAKLGQDEFLHMELTF